MPRPRIHAFVSRAILLAASMLHGTAIAAPAQDGAAPPTTTTATTTTTKAPKPAKVEKTEASPAPAAADSGADDPANKPSPNECAKTQIYQRIACHAQQRWSTKRDECNQPSPAGVTFDLCKLRDEDLALAASYAAPDEFKWASEHFVKLHDQNHAGATVVAKAALTAIKSVLKEAAPELKAYLQRRLRHERRSTIVAVLKDGLCADSSAPPLFPSTCAVVDAYAAPGQGGTVSLAVLQSAARDDLARLNATIVASQHPASSAADGGVKEALIAVVHALISEALLDNRDASIVEPLATFLRTSPSPTPSHEACVLEMTGLSAALSSKIESPAPVTSVVWAGLTVLPSCAGLVEPAPDAKNSPMQSVFDHANRLPRNKLQSAAPFLLPLNTFAASKGDDAAPASDAGETKPADNKQIPGGLRHLALRLRASAAIMGAVWGSGQSPGDAKAIAASVAWLRMFADSLEVSAAIALADYPGAAARASRRLAALGRTDGLRDIDLVVALATATDEAALERTLADGAVPAGTWRARTRRASFHITLSAMPGIQTAMEFRRGPYGTTIEPAHRVYYQAPALQLPIGFDFTWGIKDRTSLGLFVSMVDPLAFLQYDVRHQGRLPGPSVLTALAPGLGFRIGLGRSPLSLMPFVVFRPRFRAWEPSIAGPGAHALQVGVALTFDLVLFTLRNRR